jgi:hypothetical protein
MPRTSHLTSFGSSVFFADSCTIITEHLIAAHR